MCRKRTDKSKCKTVSTFLINNYNCGGFNELYCRVLRKLSTNISEMLLAILEKSRIASKEVRSINKTSLNWWNAKKYVMVSMELSWEKKFVEEEACRYIMKIGEYQL